MVSSTITTRVLDGFDDPTFGPEPWERLLCAGGSDTVYLTWHWQRAWWETFRAGELLLVAAERGGEVVALASLYTEAGMVYFVGTGFESGSLDFVGDAGDPDVLAALLDAARARVPDFLGFQLCFVPADSPTGRGLAAAAERLGLSCYNEEVNPGPVIDLAGRPTLALAATRKKDSVQHENYFRREGSLEVQHLRDGDDIRPHLAEFFAQHVQRWELTAWPSRFVLAKEREFVERLTTLAAHTGWLRFSRLEWNGRPIAFQYGFCYRGRYVRETSSFAIDLARHSPGQVLLRQAVLAALAEGARTFDFGIGEQPHKYRYATDVQHVHTWGLYPTGAPVENAGGARHGTSLEFDEIPG